MLRFFLYSLALALGTSGRAAYGQQAPTRATWVGVSVGESLVFSPSSPTRIELPPGSYLAAAGGTGTAATGAALLRVQRGRWFGQPELRYHSLYSADFTYARGPGGYGIPSGGGTATTAFHVQQLVLGALGGYAFGPGQQFYALLGPAVAVRLGTDGNAAPSAATSLSDDVRYAVDAAPGAAQLQLHGGLGWWGRHVGVEARYAYGLTPLVRRLAFDGHAYDFRVDAHALLLTVGYHGRL